MGWSIGYDGKWERDIGYGVPAFCDQPKCDKEIDRGLSYVCGGQEPYGGEYGCGLYFCGSHKFEHKFRGAEHYGEYCKRCIRYRASYDPKGEHTDWIHHKLTDESWKEWRTKNPQEVERMKQLPHDSQKEG